MFYTPTINILKIALAQLARTDALATNPQTGLVQLTPSGQAMFSPSLGLLKDLECAKEWGVALSKMRGHISRPVASLEEQSALCEEIAAWLGNLETRYFHTPKKLRVLREACRSNADGVSAALHIWFFGALGGIIIGLMEPACDPETM